MDFDCSTLLVDGINTKWDSNYVNPASSLSSSSSSAAVDNENHQNGGCEVALHRPSRRRSLEYDDGLIPIIGDDNNDELPPVLLYKDGLDIVVEFTLHVGTNWRSVVRFRMLLFGWQVTGIVLSSHVVILFDNDEEPEVILVDLQVEGDDRRALASKDVHPDSRHLQTVGCRIFDPDYADCNRQILEPIRNLLCGVTLTLAGRLVCVPDSIVMICSSGYYRQWMCLK